MIETRDAKVLMILLSLLPGSKNHQADQDKGLQNRKHSRDCLQDFFFISCDGVSLWSARFSSVSTQTCCQALCSASQQDGALSSEEGTKEWVIRNNQSAFFACRKGISRVKQIPLWGLIRGNYHFVGQKHQQLCMVSSIQNLHFLIALFLFSSWAEVVSEPFTMAWKTAGSTPILIPLAVPHNKHSHLFPPQDLCTSSLSAWNSPSGFCVVNSFSFQRTHLSCRKSLQKGLSWPSYPPLSIPTHSEETIMQTTCVILNF